MENYKCYAEYLKIDDAEIFTIVCLPNAEGKFPVMIYRTPYVDADRYKSDEQLVEEWVTDHKGCLNAGFVSIYQHCRGTGKSSGDCIPYINERKDGLFLLDWIRKQPFYNGEIYLDGASYTSTVHYACAPFAPDIKGAVLAIQDCNRYRSNYKNGIYKSGLRMKWQNDMYKKNSIPAKDKSFNLDWCRTFPLAGITEKMFGETCESFEQTITHSHKDDAFWKNSLYMDSANAVKTAELPILFMTGFYDFYVGGIMEMWRELKPEIRAKSAVIIHPYAHRIAGKDGPVDFPIGAPNEKFPGHILQWFRYCRGEAESPVEPGKVTYYKIFGDGWTTGDLEDGKKELTFTLGDGEKSYTYNPYAPATFNGGLSNHFGGTAWQDEPNSRYDIISCFTPEFEEDTFIKGKMKAKLKVKSDCEDTCFYVRISLHKEEGYLGLRDDINQISAVCTDYKPGDTVDMDFDFDEHAFVIKKGERIRIDISSSCFPNFSIHTNQKGNQALQTTAKIARNTVILNESSITVFAE